MRWFDFDRKDKILDLTKNLERKENDKTIKAKEGFEKDDNEGKIIDLTNNKEEVIDLTDISKKKKNFAKRISGMIEKIESLSTKIYHLEQRIEVLEKKTKVNNFDEE